MDQDFGGYMENLQKAEAAAARRAQMLAEHEIWLDTTWGGWIVQKLQGMARYMKPFVMTLVNTANDRNSTGKRIFTLFLFIMIIAAVLLVVAVLGKIINSVIGSEIIREEEVVVIHEFDTEEEAERARRAAESRRSKKTRKED